MRKYKIALLLPSILILFLSSRATGRTSANVHQKKTYLEQWINIEHISLEQGLFQISVSCIAQDSKGFIWFGTQGGLNRYDGYHFKAFKHHLDKSTTLNTNWVPDLYTDQKGTLWIVTTDGMLHKYNVENENFKRLLINMSYKNQRVFVNTIFMDLNGLMWVSIAGQGLLAFNPLNNENSSLNFTLIKHDTTDPNSSSDNFITSIYKDRSGSLWIGAQKGCLNKLAGFNQQNPFFIHPRFDPGNTNSITCDNVM